MLSLAHNEVLGTKYVLNVFDFDTGDSFTPISRRNTNIAVFPLGFKNFVAYAVKGSFVRQSAAVTKSSQLTGKALFFTNIGTGESLAKPDDEGTMADVIIFSLVRYKALEPSRYVCLGHTMPFVDTEIKRVEIPLLANIPFSVKANTCVILPDPSKFTVNGEVPTLPFAKSGTVVAPSGGRIIEVNYA